MALFSPIEKFHLVNKHEAAAILGISHETLKKYRLKPDSPFIEGVHYYVINTRTIRYNPVLLTDWVINRNNPSAHLKTIEAYLKATNAIALLERVRRRV